MVNQRAVLVYIISPHIGLRVRILPREIDRMGSRCVVCQIRDIFRCDCYQDLPVDSVRCAVCIRSIHQDVLCSVDAPVCGVVIEVVGRNRSVVVPVPCDGLVGGCVEVYYLGLVYCEVEDVVVGLVVVP